MLGFVGVATPEDEERWPDLPSGEVVGRAGLEQQYDAVLRGINGRQCLYVDPKGVPVALGERQDPVPGADLRLSIDLGLQRQLDASLAAAVRAQPRPRARSAPPSRWTRDRGRSSPWRARRRSTTTSTGRPSTPPALQALAGAPGSPMLEHVTQAVAPPGSTFKLVVAAANQAHPVFAPHQAIPTGADFTYGGHTFGNWKPMGPMNLVQSIAISNDVYFYKLAVALGADAMIDTARALGVGQRDRDRPPGRVRRLPRHTGLRPRRRAARGTAGPPSSSASARASCRSRRCRTPAGPPPSPPGTWSPRGSAWRSGTGRRTYTALPAPAATPLPFAAALGPVREGMRAAVTGGTAVRLAGLPAPVGAKTGTAQDGGLPDGEYDNWMTAAAPIDDPEIVMTALVQGPGTGGNSAKSVVADGLRHYLDAPAGRRRHRAGADALTVSCRP